ncbi:actin cytoskeleton protein-like protein [Pleomassaria siparia CBS 279.74]|uniref:Actin cytoskeleton protein-like protein n=1 Tax=Pleomassaria siparia CBS 279.74 TaxID=1314801 RepID=A0A6G1KI90_9PLEO|nr:actin cytoskeleton protein-like protein [Pleomassaria siparia CBS 279.74]
MATTVHVENISTKTSEDEIKSFFSFCGKIQSISVTPTKDDTQSATVTFEKTAAAKTALLLDNTQLGPNSVNVSSSKSIDELAGEKAASAEEAKDGDHHIEQEEKPRSRIVAEYLAHGYAISDVAIQKALAIDQQHGVSNKFTNTLKSFNEKFGATQKAAVVDKRLGVTEKVNFGWNIMGSYFDQAAGTPTGQKLRRFYETGNKTVMDVHNEARHLADLKAKPSSSGEKQSAEDANVSQLPGSDKAETSTPITTTTNTTT